MGHVMAIVKYREYFARTRDGKMAMRPFAKLVCTLALRNCNGDILNILMTFVFVVAVNDVLWFLSLRYDGERFFSRDLMPSVSASFS